MDGGGVSRQQFGDAADGVVRDVLEHVAQIRLRVQAVQLAVSIRL